MKRFIKSLLLCLIILQYCSCSQTRKAFSYENDIAANDSLFYPLPEAIAALSNQAADSITSIHFYKTAFDERLVERNNILERSLMNTESRQPYADYKQVIGTSQHLYLAVLETAPQNTRACVFFSIKYNEDEECIGFGPAYLGRVDKSLDKIEFRIALHPKRTKNGLFYYTTKGAPAKAINKTKGFKLLFLSKATENESILVERILNETPNKISGKKTLVIPVAATFKDSTALLFIINQ